MGRKCIGVFWRDSFFTGGQAKTLDIDISWITPKKTNMDTQNDGLEKELPFHMAIVGIFWKISGVYWILVG